jgi:hypothetical protein
MCFDFSVFYFKLCLQYFAHLLLIKIIIIAKQPFFEPEPSLENSARFDSVFTSLDFTAIIFFTEQGCQPCI